MKKKTYELLGVAFTGETITEAKQMAERELRQFIYDTNQLGSLSKPSLIPVPFPMPEYMIEVRRSVSHWETRTVFLQDFDMTSPTIASTMHFSYKQVVNMMRSHVAQQAYSKDPLRHVPERYITDKDDLQEHKGWVRWQNDYRSLLTFGCNPEEAREILSGFKPWPVEL